METNEFPRGRMTSQATRTKADDFRKQRKFSDAAIEYSRLWPNHDPWTGWGYAHCLRKLGRADEALQVARELFKLDRTFAPGRSVYAWAIFDKHIKPAEKCDATFLRAANAIVEIVGSDEGSYAATSPFVRTVMKAAKLCSASGRDLHSLEWLQKLNPLSLSITPGKTLLDGRERDFSSAREQYYSILTRAHERLQRWQECLNACNQAIAECGQLHHDNDVWFARRIALAKQALGRPEEALTELQQLVERKPRGFMQTDVARAAWQVGNLDLTYKFALMALNMPDEIGFKLEAMTILAEVLWRRGEEEKAREHLSLFLALRDWKGWKIDDRARALAADWNVSSAPTDVRSLTASLQESWKHWADELTPKQSGTIVKLLPNGHAGFIRSAKGEQFYFEARDCRRNGVKPSEGAPVLFATRAGFDRKKQRATVVAYDIRPVKAALRLTSERDRRPA
jgi:tetratricopeptide (TPR) repeat protein